VIFSVLLDIGYTLADFLEGHVRGAERAEDVDDFGVELRAGAFAQFREESLSDVMCAVYRRPSREVERTSLRRRPIAMPRAIT
jgi:hypothetical protein